MEPGANSINAEIYFGDPYLIKKPFELFLSREISVITESRFSCPSCNKHHCIAPFSVARIDS